MCLPTSPCSLPRTRFEPLWYDCWSIGSCTFSLLTRVSYSVAVSSRPSPNSCHLVPISAVFAFCGSKFGLLALFSRLLSSRLVPTGGCFATAFLASMLPFNAGPYSASTFRLNDVHENALVTGQDKDGINAEQTSGGRK